MFVRLLLAVLLCTGTTMPIADDNVIQWTDSRRLSWDDFRAAPPARASNAALTSSSIAMRFTYDGELVEYAISCNFEKNTSWGRVKNDHILAHEQGHFDIAEISARRLNQSLKRYRVAGKTVSADMNAIYNASMDELQQLQTQYDGETDHSRNVIQQKLWLARIDNMLGALPAYPVKMKNDR